MNPPYGRGIGPWVEKASESDALVVCLLPASVDARWWHEFVEGRAAVVTFLRGRQRFSEATENAPFPSVIVVYAGDVLRPSLLRPPSSDLRTLQIGS
jgi:hypothetical protein